MTHPAQQYSIVADIGGTNTRLALADGLKIVDGTVRRYANAKYDGLETVLRQYVADEGNVAAKAVCVAVAGPVQDGRAEMTNLAWSMDEDMLKRATGAPQAALLNDLQAQGHALGHIDESLVRVIVPFTDAPANATRMVVGLGTGVNVAPVFETRRGRHVPPSESGHITLPVRNATDLNLSQFVADNHGYPEVEEVLSGRGIENLYAWARREAGLEGGLSAAEIMNALAQGTDAEAKTVAAQYVRILGALVGDLALVQLPFGGIYLVGGVARAFAPWLETYDFKAALRDKGRFSDFLSQFGVGIIEDDYAALVGCAAYLQMIED